MQHSDMRTPTKYIYRNYFFTLRETNVIATFRENEPFQIMGNVRFVVEGKSSDFWCGRNEAQKNCSSPNGHLWQF